MTLNPETKLGPHVIVAPLGAGDRGEVYRARDTKLAREGGIKFLPAAMANDAWRFLVNRYVKPDHNEPLAAVLDATAKKKK
jgi:hypothetical protein